MRELKIKEDKFERIFFYATTSVEAGASLDTIKIFETHIFFKLNKGGTKELFDSPVGYDPQFAGCSRIYYPDPQKLIEKMEKNHPTMVKLLVEVLAFHDII